MPAGTDSAVLMSMIAGRVGMLWSGSRPVFESLENLSIEDIAQREIIEGRITDVLGDIVVPEDTGVLEDIGVLSGAAMLVQ